MNFLAKTLFFALRSDIMLSLQYESKKENKKMGRPSKEKENYEKIFEQLYKEKNISGNSELLRKMYTSYYKGKPGVNNDRQGWVSSQAPDLSKKIKGIRSFTDDDKKAIERALDMSWVDIVEPKPEKKKNTDFKLCGIRYAAYKDEERYYQDLAYGYDVDEYNSPLANYDEYGKTIVDYVIEYRSETGLRFLINNGYIDVKRIDLNFAEYTARKCIPKNC